MEMVDTIYFRRRFFIIYKVNLTRPVPPDFEPFEEDDDNLLTVNVHCEDT